MTPEEHMCAANPEADPDEITRFVKGLQDRGLILVPPDDTLPEGATLLSEEDVVRLTNSVVWSRVITSGSQVGSRSPVALEWAGANLYTREHYDT